MAGNMQFQQDAFQMAEDGDRYRPRDARLHDGCRSHGRLARRYRPRPASRDHLALETRHVPAAAFSAERTRGVPLRRHVGRPRPAQRKVGAHPEFLVVGQSLVARPRRFVMIRTILTRRDSHCWLVQYRGTRFACIEAVETGVELALERAQVADERDGQRLLHGVRPCRNSVAPR